jgi:hypothetical protein
MSFVDSEVRIIQPMPKSGRRWCARLAALMAVIAQFVFSPAAPAQIPCHYDLQQIVGPTCSGNPGLVTASSISPNGRYVCGSWRCSGGADRPFIWIAPKVSGEPGTFIPLQPPGFSEAYGLDVNDHGVVCGTGAGMGSGQRGFVHDLTSGQWFDIPPLNPPNGWSGAYAVNNQNEVTGYRSIGSNGDPVNPQTAFRCSIRGRIATDFVDVGLINGRSTAGRDINAVGTIAVSTGFSIDLGSLGYLWHRKWLEPVGPIPGGLTSEVVRINDAGWAIVGGMVQQGFPLSTVATFIRKPDGAFLPLPALTGLHNAGASSITTFGVVAGWSHQSPDVPTPRATVWRDAQPIDIHALLAEPFPGEIAFHAIVADSEEIVITGLLNFQRASFFLTPDKSIAGDTNCDDHVDVDDLITTILDWGQCAGCNGDLTRDGQAGVDDLLLIFLNWGHIGGAR